MMNTPKFIRPFSEIKCNQCDFNGFIITENSALKCDCRIKYENEISASEILIKSGLLTEDSSYDDFKKLIDFKFSDYRGKDESQNIPKLKKYVSEFDSDIKPFKHLHCYVYGKQGTQKSHIMRGLLTKMAKLKKNVGYIFAKDLVGLIIDSERNEESNKKLNYFQNCDVLVIDEFDEQRICLWSSGFKEKSMIVWLKNRLEIIRKSTWIISNLTIEEQKSSKLGELFGDLLDRETRYGRFEFKDKFSDYITQDEINEKLKFIWD